MSRRRRGVALVTAVVIATVAAAIATGLAERQSLAVARTTQLLHSGQADQFAQAALRWATERLQQNARQTELDHRGQRWAQPVPALDVGPRGGSVSGAVQDLQSRFNLANLAGGDAGPARARLARLVRTLGLNPSLAGAIQGWVARPDREIAGAPSPLAYARKKPPYRPAGRIPAGISELRAIDGVTAQVYRQLAPHLAALPAATAINVNTAGPAVLASLADGLDRASARALTEARSTRPFADVAAFRNAVERIAGNDVAARIDPAAVTIHSHYFRVRAVARFGKARSVQYGLVAVDDARRTAHLLRREATPM